MYMSGQKAQRASRAEWVKRVQRWEKSGRTAEAFGAEIGVNGRTLAYWRWLLRKESQGEPRTWPRKGKQGQSASVTPSFVEVRAGAAESRFVLELGDGRRLLVPRDFDAGGLRRLLGALEGA
jgi:transposase